MTTEHNCTTAQRLSLQTCEAEGFDVALRSCTEWVQQPAILVYIPYAPCALLPCGTTSARVRQLLTS